MKKQTILVLAMSLIATNLVYGMSTGQVKVLKKPGYYSVQFTPITPKETGTYAELKTKIEAMLKNPINGPIPKNIIRKTLKELEELHKSDTTAATIKLKNKKELLAIKKEEKKQKELELKTKYDMLNASRNQIPSTQKNVTETEKKLLEIKTQLDTLRYNLSLLQAGANTTQNEINLLEQQKAILANKIASLEKEITNIETSLGIKPKRKN